MPTTVVHVNDPGGYDVYIGRAVPRRGFKASPFANPFREGVDGDRDTVIELFRQWVTSSPDPRAVYINEHVHELRGRRLGCWCKRGGRNVPCHGDVLAELADAGEG